MLKNKKGFGSVQLYMALAIVIMGVVGFFWIKALRADVKHWKAETEKAQTALTLAKAAQADTEAALEEQGKACAQAIADYQAMLNESLDAAGPCLVVEIHGCPQFAITEDPEKDSLLKALVRMFKRRAP